MTILLQDKRGVNYCIACSELDSDVDKDNPVMNQEAALATQREHQASSSSTASSQISSGHGSHTLAFSANQASQTPSSSANQRQAFSANHIPPEVCVRTDRDPNLPPRTVNVVDILKEKMCWACNELQRTSSVEYSSQLCQLVKHCAEAVHSVQTNLTN